MKKKLTLYHGLILFVSLLLLLVGSLFTLSQINRKNQEESLRDYLALTVEIVNKEEETSPSSFAESTGSVLQKANPDIRLTIIQENGNVLYDSELSSVEENHLDRPEIKNLGNIYLRYSSTLKENMMYLAGKDSSSLYYIRLAMPLSSIDRIIWLTCLFSVVLLMVVLILSVLVDSFLVKKSLYPLKRETARLGKIVGEEPVFSSKDEIEELTYQIDKTDALIQEKVSSLTKEKEKLNFILDTIQQGLLIVSKKEEVFLINKKAKEIFSYSGKEGVLLPKVTILPEIETLFQNALEGKESQSEVKIGSRTYLLMSQLFQSDWIDEGKEGVAISLVDITEEKSLQSAKKDFFANASHELKSPLTTIIGYTEMIKNGFFTEKKDIDDAMDRILFASKRMDKIIKEMLKLSELEANTKKAKEDCSVLSSLKTQVQSLEEQAKEKEVTIEFSGENFSVPFDKEDLDILFRNLIENAIRYNKENGKVFIRMNPDKRSVEIKDTGIGIAKEEQSRIFERFYRVDKARSRELGGTGLGLSIVKHICENNQVKLTLQSELNQGSNFILEFDI